MTESTAVNEHVQMMIAAGWINAGDVDPEYQDYLRRARENGVHPFETLDYVEWQGETARWKELNTQYVSLLGVGWVDHQDELDVALNEMYEIEVNLIW